MGVYGPGGMYAPHRDSLKEDKLKRSPDNVWLGDRVATVLIYVRERDIFFQLCYGRLLKNDTFFS